MDKGKDRDFPAVDPHDGPLYGTSRKIVSRTVIGIDDKLKEKAPPILPRRNPPLNIDNPDAGLFEKPAIKPEAPKDK